MHRPKWRASRSERDSTGQCLPVSLWIHLSTFMPVPHRHARIVIYSGDIAMTTVDQLFATAAQRATEAALAYRGAVTPSEAFELLQMVPNARLIDVRTRAELDWVGRPLVESGQYAHIEWVQYPGSVRNTAFIESLREVAQPDTPVLLLCRSAVRSKAAAELATQSGFTNVFDILEGFEGDKDTTGHRKSVGGWCFRGLPWSGA